MPLRAVGRCIDLLGPVSRWGAGLSMGRPLTALPPALEGPGAPAPAPGAAALQVRYLKVVERSGYEALPWVRYITQAGDYQIRMN